MCRDYQRDVRRRVINADYLMTVDDQASWGSRDLLSQILVADPTHRATIHDVVHHPWFQLGLPCNPQAFNDKEIKNQRTDRPKSRQSRDEIRRIVEEARRTSDSTNEHFAAGIDGSTLKPV